MKIVEARKLKIGDLVVLDNRSKFGGLVMEVEAEPIDCVWCCSVNLKQPKFDGGFRLESVDTRYLKRFES